MYNVTLVNKTDGSVDGHRAGCADVKKQRADSFDVEVSSKEEARAEYNADFDEETDGWYDIHWLPCADHVPSTDKVSAETVNNAELTVKHGRKWTSVYSPGGALIAEVLTAQLGAVLDVLTTPVES